MDKERVAELIKEIDQILLELKLRTGTQILIYEKVKDARLFLESLRMEVSK